MMKMSEARKVPVVFGEVGVRDPLFHLSSECEAIPAEDRAGRACDAAKAQGSVITEGGYRARVEYKDGEYTVTR